MARPKFPYTRSDETFEVLKEHVAAVAKQYPCNDSHICRIKNGEANDPFPPFLALFIPAANGGAPVRAWMRRLESHIPKALVTGIELVKLLAEKIEKDADSTSEIVRDIEDHHVDDRECDRIYDKCQASIDLARSIQTQVLWIKTERSEKRVSDARGGNVVKI